MCFSAQASFLAGMALAPAGLYCCKNALHKDRRYLPLAMVPLAFSVQQFYECLVWIGIEHRDASLVERASVAFLFFAIAFWPFWIPFSIFAVEKRRNARMLLGGLAILSLPWLWLYLPIALQPTRWLTTEVVHHSIRYDYGGLPGFSIAPPAAWRLGYLLIVAVPAIVGWNQGQANSGRNNLSVLAGLMLVRSFVVSYLVFWYAFTSVWCFFAALLALFLCHVFSQLPQANPQRQTTWAAEMVSGGQT